MDLGMTKKNWSFLNLWSHTEKYLKRNSRVEAIKFLDKWPSTCVQGLQNSVEAIIKNMNFDS